jgi:hypothetical protein
MTLISLLVHEIRWMKEIDSRCKLVELHIFYSQIVCSRKCRRKCRVCVPPGTNTIRWNTCVFSIGSGPMSLSAAGRVIYRGFGIAIYIENMQWSSCFIFLCIAYISDALTEQYESNYSYRSTKSCRTFPSCNLNWDYWCLRRRTGRKGIVKVARFRAPWSAANTSRVLRHASARSVRGSSA